MGFAPRDPRDFPRAKPEGNPEGRGVQNPWPREISRAEGMDFPIPPESWWSTDILSSLPGKALIGFHRYLMKTNENQPLLIKTYEQWKPTNTNEWKICIWWHLCVWIFCICLFLYFCAGFLFLFYLFVIIIIFFSSSTLLFMRTKEREIISCFWLEFIMMMVILSCSSQWLTEDAVGRTLCICVFFPCICILALFFCSLKPYFFTKKFCIPWWIIIDPSMQHCIGCMECLIANLSSFWWKFLDAEQKRLVITTSNCWNYIEYNVKWNACRKMALSGFLKSGKVCFSDFGTRTFVMFRLIPGIFGHAKIMLRYFRTSNIISNVIGCNFMYRLFNIHSTYNQCHHFCLPAWVFTVHCLISIELPAVCSSREDGCSILSLGRGLVNLVSRERIG